MTSDSKTLTKDEVLFKETETGDCAYIIESGSILIYLERDGEETPIAVLGEGEIFGEMSLIDNEPRSAYAKALTPAKLHIVSKEQLVERISNSDTVVHLLMKVLIGRLRRNSQKLLKLNSEIDVQTDVLPRSTVENQSSSAVNALKFETEIYNAFKNNEFTLYFQPIMDIKSGKIAGCEALCRWIKNDGTYVSPNIFMNVIESSSMALPIGRWIIEQSIKACKKIMSDAKVPDSFFMSINICGKQFQDPQFLVHLSQLSTQYKVLPSNIKLEITERIMADGVLALEMLNQCHDAKYKLAIDDFGTGFSSIQYLASMPVDDLKIDSSFVRTFLTSAKSMAVVKSIIYMAKLLNMRLIAEGIETEADLKALKDFEVEFGQGYLFSKAVPIEDFIKLYKLD